MTGKAVPQNALKMSISLRTGKDVPVDMGTEQIGQILGTRLAVDRYPKNDSWFHENFIALYREKSVTILLFNEVTYLYYMIYRKGRADFPFSPCLFSHATISTSVEVKNKTL